MIEVELSPEQMVLVMELAGWTYIYETDTDWACISRDGTRTCMSAIYANHGDCAVIRAQAVNIKNLFAQYLYTQESQTT